MSRSLDLSLDDIIRQSKQSGGRQSNSSFRGRGYVSSRGSASGSVLGPGPDRRLPRQNLARTSPYPIQPAMQVMEPVIFPGGGANAETGTKLYVSNLDYGVSNEDIKVLFAEVGELKRYSIHYDKSGRSKGTAEVVFVRQTDALAAIKRYNNVHLDGKPLKIELVGLNLLTPAPVPLPASIHLGKPNGAFRSGQGRIGARGRGRVNSGNGNGARGLGRGPVQGRSSFGKKSAEELDAELEKYHLEALQIN